MATSTDGYALLKTIALPGSVGGHGDWVAYDSATNTVWLAQSPDNNVVVIDAATNTVKATIPNIGNANGVDFSSQYAFVADVTGDTLDVIDKNTFQVVARVAVPGTTPDGVHYISSTNQVAVASDDANQEYFFNATPPFALTNTVQLTPNPAVAGPDVSTYVASKDLLYQPVDNTVNVINPHTGAIVATWTLLSSASQSVKPGVYDPNTNTFIFGSTNKQLLVVNADTGAVIKTIAISGSVDESSINVAARLAFFGDKAGVADIVNLDTDTLVGGLPAEVNMHTLAVDPNTNAVYVYENNRNTVDVYVPVPSAPTYTSSNVSSGAQTIISADNAEILAGNLTLRSPNADGSAPTVPSGSSGVLYDTTGGKTLVLPSTYAGAVLTGSAPDTVFGGGGVQSIISGSAGGEFILNGGTHFLYAGGNNVVFDTNDTSSINLDNGNNIILDNGSNSGINAGTGSNLIGVTQNSTGVVVVNSTGNDTVLAGGGTVLVNASHSSASVSETVFDTGATLGFVGGAGNAVVVGISGRDIVFGGSGSLLASGNSTGNDLLVGGTGQATLFGGGNGDLLIAGQSSDMLVAGAGNETLEGAFPGYVTSAAQTYFTGSGNATIGMGNGNDTAFAGSGTSTITTGAGSDLIAIVNGRAGGTATINGFNANDHISLQGYGSNAAANAVAGEQTVNGSAVISLSDGTKITFTGVPQINSGSFV